MLINYCFFIFNERQVTHKIQHRYQVFKDHITLGDYEIKDGMGLELYYN